MALLVRLPDGGTLGDLYTPVNIQIAVRISSKIPNAFLTSANFQGIYPLLVLLLVNQQRSLNDNTVFGNIKTIQDSSTHPTRAPTRLETIRFTPSLLSIGTGSQVTLSPTAYLRGAANSSPSIDFSDGQSNAGAEQHYKQTLTER
jgi:hypothetical protein